MNSVYVLSRVQFFSILGSIALIVLLALLIRKRKLLEEYSILWLIIFTVFLLVAIFGAFLESVARFLGILYAPAAMFLLVIVGIFCLLLHFSIVISDMKRKINTLSTKNALLEEKIRDKKNSDEN